MLRYYLEWSKWEDISHIALSILYFYIFYKFAVDPSTRKFSNILLFTLITSVDVVIHKLINISNSATEMK